LPNKLISWLASIEIWITGLLAATSMAIPALLPLTVAIMVIYWPFRYLATGKFTRRSAADLAIVVLLLMVPATLWVSGNRDITLVQVYRLLVGIGLYYSLVNWANKAGRLAWIVRGIFLVGLVFVVIAPFSVQSFMGKLPFLAGELYRPFLLLVSDTVHPNVLAGSLVLLLPFALAFLIFNWGQMVWWERLLGLAAGLGMIIILVFSQSRGGLLALGVTMLLLIALRWRWGWGLLLLMGLAGVGVLIWFGWEQPLGVVLSSSTIGNLAGRLEIWYRAVAMMQDFPLTGVGMGNFAQITAVNYPLLMFNDPVPHTHNLFFQVGVDLGVPGLIAWL
jgi:putative inorganic carbon (HCO3(-)) transporter